MSMQDPVSDMLTRLRNAQMVGKKFVEMPASKLKTAIAVVLQEEGYIISFDLKHSGSKHCLSVELKYFEGKPVIAEIDRFSRPGLRRFAGKNELPLVRGGLGIAIISTSHGVMTDRAARAASIGGEVLCTVF